MRVFSQLLIVLSVWLVGEVISRVFSLPISGNVLGMFVMILLLSLKIVKIEQISKISDFFLDNIAIFFVPGVVAIIVSYGQIQAKLWQTVVAIIASSVIVFAATGYTVELLLRVKKRRERKKRGGQDG